MGLITEEVEVTLSPRNIKHFENLGYKIPRRKDKWGVLTTPKGTTIIVNVKHLQKGSCILVDVKCDCCNKELKNITWYAYLKCVKDEGKYYCIKCSHQLSGIENHKQTKLKNSKSFEQWCIQQNNLDILDYWDAELNNCLPSEILYTTHKKYYFKCPRGLHRSELKLISSFTKGNNLIKCNQCNSIAQYGLDNLGKDFIEKYWSYKNIINPWECAPYSKKETWWKCPDGIHEDYPRLISNSNIYDFRCPGCQFSKGEKRINNYLIDNQITYIPQKEFEGLVGLKGGLLSYDSYLPNYNLLVEYQGEQHERYIPGFHKSKKDFLKQVEHDKRKKEYAQSNNIKLLEIWYWDYENIGSILSKELNLTNSTYPTYLSEDVM